LQYKSISYGDRAQNIEKYCLIHILLATLAVGAIESPVELHPPSTLPQWYYNLVLYSLCAMHCAKKLTELSYLIFTRALVKWILFLSSFCGQTEAY
jgi:hypothetical protein